MKKVLTHIDIGQWATLADITFWLAISLRFTVSKKKNNRGTSVHIEFIPSDLN